MSEENTTIDNQVTAPEATESVAPQADLLGSEAKTEAVADVAAAPQDATAEAAARLDFMGTLSEDLRKEKSLHNFKDNSALAKSYVELQSKFGKRIEDLTAEEVKSLDSKFGAPEKAEDYGIKLPEGIESDSVLANISQDFLEAGIPKDKAEKLMSSILGKMEESNKMEETNFKIQAEDNVKTIKTEFGTAFDDRLELANKALRELGGPEAIEALARTGLANDPAMFRMLSKVGSLIAEDKPIGDKSNSNFGISPAEAEEKLAQLHGDRAFMERLSDVNHPGHNEATAQREKLYRLKAGKR